MSKYLVIGSNSFLGRTLCCKLRDNPEYEVKEFHHTQDFDEFIQQNSNEEFECCYIMSWGGGHGAKIRDLDAQFSNVDFIYRLISLLKELCIKKIVYASSIAEFAFIKSICKNCTLPAVSLYGGSKLYAHLIIRNFCEKNEINFAAAYFSNVYGPGANSASFIGSCLPKLIFTDEVLKFSSGEQLYDFIYIDDLIIDLIQLGASNNFFGHFLLGSGKFRPLKEYIIEMCSVFDKDNEKFLQLGVYPAGENLDLTEFPWLDVDFLSNLTGAPRTNFIVGIKKTADFIKSNKVIENSSNVE